MLTRVVAETAFVERDEGRNADVAWYLEVPVRGVELVVGSPRCSRARVLTPERRWCLTRSRRYPLVISNAIETPPRGPR